MADPIRAELKQQAERLRPTDRRLMAVKGRGGSDLLGALQLAARLFRDYPDRPRNLVLLTDGAITADGVNLTRHAPANTQRARARLIDRLRADGRLPDISGGAGQKPRVWIGGLGHDTQGHLSPRASRDILAPVKSAPGWIRTSDLRIRSPLLYPAELQGPERRELSRAAESAGDRGLGARRAGTGS